MAITAAGRELLPLADGVLERVRHLEDRLQSGVVTPPGPLRVAAAPVLGQHILPLALREFRETCPEIALHVDLCGPRDAVAGLLDGRIDLALTVPHPGLDGVAVQALAEDDLHLVAHPLHPWVTARRARLDSPDGTRFILPDRRDSTRALIDEYLRVDGLTIPPAMEIPGEDCIQRFVRLDLGVGILPRWVIADELERGQLASLPLGRRRLRRTWAALHSRIRPLSFGEHLFANLCGSVLREHIARHP
jgi:DNA-binding transcriptional LysR family regulator